VSIAPKSPPLMTEAPATPYFHPLTFDLPSAHMPLTSQPSFYFRFQRFFQAAPYHLSDLGFQHRTQFLCKSSCIAGWHLQKKAPDGYNGHDLISCRLWGSNHILQADQVLFCFFMNE
jgi:hypothetical protein